MPEIDIAKLEFFPVNVYYTHVEKSSQVDRAGVSDIVVKATTSDGLVGWGRELQRGKSCFRAGSAGGNEAFCDWRQSVGEWSGRGRTYGTGGCGISEKERRTSPMPGLIWRFGISVARRLDSHFTACWEGASAAM